MLGVAPVAIIFMTGRRLRRAPRSTMMVAMIDVRDVETGDRSWIEDLLAQWWGSTQVVSRGRVHDALALPGFIAVDGGERIGLATYHLAERDCELVTLNSIAERRGAGTALIGAVIDAARESGCRRTWLVTTNDNLAALRFYQRRSFTIAAIHVDAIEQSRRLKPQIPAVGIDGIPIRDEIELQREL